MHELINGVKFVTVMARISVSLVLRFSFSGVIFFFLKLQCLSGFWSDYF